MSELTQEYLKECLHYNPESGEFTWNVRPRHHFRTDPIYKMWNTHYSNKPAGSKVTPEKSRTSYLWIGIDGKNYRAHRLAWLYVHGAWPDNSIDHIDGSGLNNKLINLRDVTNRQNQMNRKTQLNNTSGFTGVVWDKNHKKFQARIKINGKQKNLGSYNTLEAAAAARAAAELEHGYTTPEAQ